VHALHSRHRSLERRRAAFAEVWERDAGAALTGMDAYSCYPTTSAAGIVNGESTSRRRSPGGEERLHLYQGTTKQFIADATQARLANQLSDRFFDEFRYGPAPSEVTSWRNSLSAMAHVLQIADLTDQGILVELKLPLSSKRLDVLLKGSNPATGDSAVVVELKQWTDVGRSNITDCVTVDFGGRPRDTSTRRARSPSSSATPGRRKSCGRWTTSWTSGSSATCASSTR
jgi:hypothetical protein